MNNLTGRFVVPDIATSNFHLHEGDVVADFGAGSGFFLKPLAEAVGPEGRVYACDIQKQLVEKLGELIHLNGLANVSPIWCDLEEPNGTKLSDGVLDAAILVNTLFQFEQKEVAIQEIRRVLKTGGVLHIIDWSESFSGLGPQQKDVITQQAAIDLLESEQFTFEKEYPTGDHHYGITVRKI